MKYIWIALTILGIGFVIWCVGDNADAQACRQKYGSSYTLWHSSANSSIKACKSPNGELKAL